MVGEEYVEVEGIVVHVRPKAVLFEPEGAEAGVWIPRSCVHGADARLLDSMDVPQSVVLRIVEWLVEREGLI